MKKQNFFTNDLTGFQEKAFQFLSTYTYCAFLNGNAVENYPYSSFKTIWVASNLKKEIDSTNQLSCIEKSTQNSNSFGYLSYDFKNEIHLLNSNNEDFIHFENTVFFEPQILITPLNGSEIIIEAEEPLDIYNHILNFVLLDLKHNQKFNFFPSITKEEYTQKVNEILGLIEEGKLYELNFCMSFEAENVFLDPLSTYQILNDISKMPFSAFAKFDDNYIICASPERFLKKENLKLITQPIKGTKKRGKTIIEDIKLQNELQNSEKEIAENMMIVDLVRNDLAKSSEIGSVCVEEAFKIYSFPFVHQMISTVTSKLDFKTTGLQALTNAFPMGSMTGAPKLNAMKYIDELENRKRGPFSGALGFFDSKGDFDFNVLIRSIFYNKKLGRVSFSVGSAITIDSKPEKEYEECLLKAKAIFNVFEL